MRIAFIVESFPKLSETFILNQVTGLLDLGYEVDIFPSKFQLEEKMHTEVSRFGLLSRTYYPPSSPTSKWAAKLKCIWLIIRNVGNIETISRMFSSNYPSDVKISLFFRLLPLIGKEAYDIVHCHFGPLGKIAVYAKSLDIIRGKLLLSFYGYDATRYNLDAAYYRSLIPYFDGFITISNYLKSKLKDLEFPEGKLITIPLGVNLEEYCVQESSNLKSGKRLLTVARLVEKKGIYYGIMAFSKLLRSYPDLEYHIVGDGVLFEKLKELTDELSLNGHVFLHGAKNREEIKEFYAAADIFVLPSITASDGNSEGQGLVLQEAQAMEVPVVATRHNGIPEGILEGITGHLVPERDIDALSDSIRNLLDDNELRNTMGKKGRELVVAKFSNKKLVGSLAEYYESILNG
ncbi:MAG: glycosyltransferase [Lunatimonas sp.]|jgi:colanic acid/amylovoran biosynthesis glycosyltransferase|uniref:glycosyltransferase n=1 Tax=Lunatimonas sp. TaxID=2060141 RepID=UPI00263AC8D0|nr:glycosyltransferase [Lunatimonas sp.]MCC5936875.1 glycosyltransferase [Lunatimonas sp.]